MSSVASRSTTSASEKTRYLSLALRLYMGHLVLDSPVPSKLLVHCPNKTDKEFTTMR